VQQLLSQPIVRNLDVDLNRHPRKSAANSRCESNRLTDRRDRRRISVSVDLEKNITHRSILTGRSDQSSMRAAVVGSTPRLFNSIADKPDSDYRDRSSGEWMLASLVTGLADNRDGLFLDLLSKSHGYLLRLQDQHSQLPADPY
jgi:hypothetical protein